ncbi:hypothetical protein RGR602_CH02354 [Rhizobium gallicum bv. gallicum R602sp]|uniref:DUF3606 domain-containing protein n=1 Tax=Rhizobium gallicum bv. gallicum R602sp TaxID=1041138 RepID=A0A0B4X4M5_9HYPH|nr:hypothetical protein RGR602_CH02354 [Rhizobium gallicum bv. gallicum R602sp]
MSNSTRGRNQDRARVAGGQDHEVRYEAKKEGVSKDKVKQTVKEVGNSRAKVEERLEKWAQRPEQLGPQPITDVALRSLSFSEDFETAGKGGLVDAVVLWSCSPEMRPRLPHPEIGEVLPRNCAGDLGSKFVERRLHQAF